MLLDRQAAQIGKFFVSLVYQKQGLLTIPHENPGAMSQLMMHHRTLLSSKLAHRHRVSLAHRPRHRPRLVSFAKRVLGLPPGVQRKVLDLVSKCSLKLYSLPRCPWHGRYPNSRRVRVWRSCRPIRHWSTLSHALHGPAFKLCKARTRAAPPEQTGQVFRPMR